MDHQYVSSHVPSHHNTYDITSDITLPNVSTGIQHRNEITLHQQIHQRAAHERKIHSLYIKRISHYILAIIRYIHYINKLHTSER
jgi:hypothetical protein